MFRSKVNHLWQFIACLLLCFAGSALGAEPGVAYPPTAEVSDQKLGSVLVFPFFSSSATPAQEDTRFAITNQNQSASVSMHIYFVNGATGVVADSFIALTPNQTASFLASDVDPGVRGFVLAIAIGNDGAPLNFNHLAGVADIKLATGHRATLRAEAIAAITLPVFSGVTATLNFDGVAYNRLPRALAADKIKSSLDSNTTVFVLTRITGDYAMGNLDPIGAVAGNLYDDAGNAFPFSFNQNSVQLVQTFGNSFPVTTPSFDTVIPSGRTGWLYLATMADAGLFGAVINLNPNAGIQAGAFSGGHNSRALTLSASNSIIIPIL